MGNTFLNLHSITKCLTIKVKVTLLVTFTHTPMAAAALQVAVEVMQFLAQ